MKTYFGTQKSSIFEMWTAPGAPETTPNGGARSAPPFGVVSGPWGRPDPKIDDFCRRASRFDSLFISFVEFWPARESFGMARGLRFWALGVDSGPRGGAFEGISDPPKIIQHICVY